MLSYSFKCKKNPTTTTTENINPRVSNTSNGKTMLLSKCAVCDSKKSKFIKKQEAKGILSSLSIKTPLSKAPLLGDILFWAQPSWVQFHWPYKMNEIVNKSIFNQ